MILRGVDSVLLFTIEASVNHPIEADGIDDVVPLLEARAEREVGIRPIESAHTFVTPCLALSSKAVSQTLEAVPQATITRTL